jgi:hypothetical protein
VDPDLLFAGTEFGLFFTSNGGKKWTQLKAGLPTIAIRDIEIQKRENDLVLASFGRGFYILDDYSLLRNLDPATYEKDAHIFPIKDALLFMESYPLGLREKSFQGESFYTAENPPTGAVFTCFIKEPPKSLKQQRIDAEKEAIKKGEAVSYPSFEAMRAEDDEESAFLLFTIRDAEGNVVDRIKTGIKKGINRSSWNLRYPPVSPVDPAAAADSDNPFSDPDLGPLALPGTYTLSISQSVDGKQTELAGPQSFRIVPLFDKHITATDRARRLAFMQDVGELRKAVHGANKLNNEMLEQIKYIKAAILATPDASMELWESARALEVKLTEYKRQLSGDRSLESREFETPPSIRNRVDLTVYGLMGSTESPTGTMKTQYEAAFDLFRPVRDGIEQAATQDIKTLEKALEKAGSPWIPGQIPKMPRKN